MYYKNDLKSAYLILEGEEGEEEDYQVAMMQENEIPGLLKAQTRFLTIVFIIIMTSVVRHHLVCCMKKSSCHLKI